MGKSKNSDYRKLPDSNLTDKELYLAGKEDILYLRTESRYAGQIEDICKRLVGMGRCNNTCPEACPEYNTIGLTLFRQEFQEALSKDRFAPSGFLKIIILDDDFRRLWSIERKIVPKILNNKLIRDGKPTKYGSIFAEAMEENETLELMGSDTMTRLKSAESWLRNLWDDACDNAEMDIAVYPGSMESTYRHPQRFMNESIYHRYGYRADRILRRRLNVEHELNIDLNIDESIRPRSGLDDSMLRVCTIANELLKTMEHIEKCLEEYHDAPESLTVNNDALRKLDDLHISHTKDEEWVQLSRDDMDRFSDGVVDEKNPAILYDDFYDAWFKTRRSDGLREISLSTPTGEGTDLLGTLADSADDSE